MPTRKNSHGNRERRQTEAKQRQEAYDKLTVPQKIDRLDESGSSRQREKLLKLAKEAA